MRTRAKVITEWLKYIYIIAVEHEHLELSSKVNNLQITFGIMCEVHDTNMADSQLLLLSCYTSLALHAPVWKVLNSATMNWICLKFSPLLFIPTYFNTAGCNP